MLQQSDGKSFRSGCHCMQEVPEQATTQSGGSFHTHHRTSCNHTVSGEHSRTSTLGPLVGRAPRTYTKAYGFASCHQQSFFVISVFMFCFYSSSVCSLDCTRSYGRCNRSKAMMLRVSNLTSLHSYPSMHGSDSRKLSLFGVSYFLDNMQISNECSYDP